MTSWFDLAADNSTLPGPALPTAAERARLATGSAGAISQANRWANRRYRTEGVAPDVVRADQAGMSA